MTLRTGPFIALLLGEMVATAQGGTSHVPQWSYRTEVVQSAMLHFNLRAQRSFKRWDFGIHAGYRPSLWSGGEIPSGGAGSSYFGINYRNWMYQAVTIGPLIRYHLTPDGRSFVELDAFHRIWWFDRKNVSYDNVESLQFDGLRSERQDISALRLLWGASSAPRKDRKGRRALVMEGYAGLGVRSRRMRFTTHQGVLNNYWPPLVVTEDRVDRYNFVTPTVHFGIRLALVSRERTP